MFQEFPPTDTVHSPEADSRREQVLQATRALREKLLSYSHRFVDDPKKEIPPEEEEGIDDDMELPETYERYYVSEDPEEIVRDAEDFREENLRRSGQKLAKLTAGLVFAKLVSAYIDLGAAVPHVDHRAFDTVMNMPTLGGAALAAVLMVMKYREADTVFGSTDQNDPEAIAALARQV